MIDHGLPQSGARSKPESRAGELSNEFLATTEVSVCGPNWLKFHLETI
jgi:hypothetical protein